MAKSSALTPEMLAAFAAKGGKIVRIATGEGHGFTDRQWYAASQGRVDLNRKIQGPSDNELIEQRRVIGNVVVNGLGELIGEI
jgi:hypothetical protein